MSKTNTHSRVRNVLHNLFHKNETVDGSDASFENSDINEKNVKQQGLLHIVASRFADKVLSYNTPDDVRDYLEEAKMQSADDKTNADKALKAMNFVQEANHLSFLRHESNESYHEEKSDDCDSGLYSDPNPGRLCRFE